MRSSPPAPSAGLAQSIRPLSWQNVTHVVKPRLVGTRRTRVEFPSGLSASRIRAAIRIRGKEVVGRARVDGVVVSIGELLRDCIDANARASRRRRSRVMDRRARLKLERSSKAQARTHHRVGPHGRRRLGSPPRFA